MIAIRCAHEHVERHLLAALLLAEGRADAMKNFADRNAIVSGVIAFVVDDARARMCHRVEIMRRQRDGLSVGPTDMERRRILRLCELRQHKGQQQDYRREAAHAQSFWIITSVALMTAVT